MSKLKRVTQGSNYDKLKHFTLGRNILPILRVEPGERFVAEIEDSFGGLLKKLLRAAGDQWT